MRIGRGMRALQFLWFPAGALVCWEVLASVGVLDPLFFPPPSRLASEAVRLLRSGELIEHLSATLSRLWLGFLVGTTCGVGVGLLMGTVAPLRRSFEPLISALYTTPKMSLLPMVMLLVGIGDAPRILLAALASFVMSAIHSLDGVRNVNPAHVELAVNHGARGFALLRRVYIPSAMPQLFTGVRLALGRALMVTIAVELVSSPDGLGSMIWMSWQTFATEKLYLGVMIAAGLGALFHRGLLEIERQWIPWKRV